MDHKNCSNCNAGMPSWRVNPLCEECVAEMDDEYDVEANDDENEMFWDDTTMSWEKSPGTGDQRDYQ